MEDLLVWLLAAHPLLVIAGLFSLDGMGLPVLPEVVTLLIFAPEPTLDWGLQILAIIAVVETAAAGALFLVVRKVGLHPRLERAMSRYAAMLLGKDERLLLLNRFVPVLPAAGAFIHAANWRPMRSLAFIAIGSVLKYGLLLAGSALAFQWMDPTDATVLSVGAAAVFVGASWLVGRHQRRRAAAQSATASA